MKTFKEFVSESAEWRAKHPDESEVLHHVTSRDFDGPFKPFTHFGTKDAARSIAADVGGTHNIHSVRIRLGNVAHVPDVGGEHEPEDIVNVLHYAGHIDNKERKDVLHKIGHAKSYDEAHSHLTNLLHSKNIHTLSYTNTSEDPGSKSYMITDPKQVRVLRKVKAPLNYERGEAKRNNDDRDTISGFHRSTFVSIHTKDRHMFKKRLKSDPSD